MLAQQLVNGIALGATYALIAIGYTLIFGILRVLHLAHGEVFVAGALAGLTLLVASGGSLALALAGSLAAAVAVRPETLALDREKVRRALEAVRNFPGITGRTSINAEGDVDKQVFVIVAREGR